MSYAHIAGNVRSDFGAPGGPRHPGPPAPVPAAPGPVSPCPRPPGPPAPRPRAPACQGQIGAKLEPFRANLGYIEGVINRWSPCDREAYIHSNQSSTQQHEACVYGSRRSGAPSVAGPPANTTPLPRSPHRHIATCYPAHSNKIYTTSSWTYIRLRP